jgi:hypothetical protein
MLATTGLLPTLGRRPLRCLKGVAGSWSGCYVRYVSVDDEIVSAIREAIAPMWRDTQDRISNLRDSLRKDIEGTRRDIEGTKSELSKRIDDSRAATEARLQAVESRLAETIASIEKLWERQPIVIDFERFRKLEERLARLEDKLGS